MKINDSQIRSIANTLYKQECKKRAQEIDKIKNSLEVKKETKIILKELDNLSPKAKIFIPSHINENFIMNNVITKLSNKIPHIDQQTITDKVNIATIESEDLKGLLKKLGLKEI